jgi:hypothetical protein
MRISKPLTEVRLNGRKGHGKRLQITPEERFEIRTSIAETAGTYATAEQGAEMRSDDT